MQSPLLSGQTASLVERADLPLPSGVFPSGHRPVASVGAQPRHPSNAVLVEVRRADGPPQFLRVVAEAIRGEAQWFRTLLPPLEEGSSLNYRVQLVRAGQLLATLPADGSWLTVTGDEAMSSVPPARPSAPPCPHFAYDLQHLAAVSIALRPDIVGDTPEGYRINFVVEEGRATGSRIDAVIQRDGGGDWLCVRHDGVATLDARMTWHAADGAVFDYRSGGVLDLGADGYARVRAGQLAGDPPFYATPRFMTSHPRWQWLNRVQGFGFGRVDLGQRRIRFDIYVPEVQEPSDGA